MFLGSLSAYAFYILIAIPALSYAVLLVLKNSNQYKWLLLNTQYVLLIAFAIIWYQYEQAMLAEGVNIRLDMLIILPCAIAQVFMPIASFLHIRDMKLRDDSKKALDAKLKNKKGA
jgi:hypothetical protein